MLVLCGFCLYLPLNRYQAILDVCYSAGESEKVMQGIHENYLEAKSKDPFLSGVPFIIS